MRRLLFVTAALLAGGVTDAIAQGVSFQARHVTSMPSDRFAPVSEVSATPRSSDGR
jgi:hypothetical protein